MWYAGASKGRNGRRMSVRRILVTGGSGFLGSALVKGLVRQGETVRVFDDNSRGALRRLGEVERDSEFVRGDIRDPAGVDAAVRGIDEVHHLAFVHGTATFYSAPDLVLDVGVKGIVNVIDACRRHGVGQLILASSSEVYQSPPRVPTDESAPLVVPDPLNPRLSYGAGKIISEVMVIRAKGEHLGIYHVGTTEEVSVADLARRMAKIAGREIVLGPSAVLEGSTPRRCADISKLAALGYRPRVPLDEGLPPTLKWYWDHESMAPAA